MEDDVNEQKVRRSQLAAASPSSAAPSEDKIGRGRVAAAVVGLLVLAGGLTALATSVRDDAVASSKNHVEPGKISVIGTSRLRTWTGDSFSLTMPSAWENTESTPVRYTNFPDPHVHRFVWTVPGKPGKLTVYVGREYYTLSQRGITALTSPRKAAITDRDTMVDDPNERRVVRPGDDLGPININGTRPAWRWLHSSVKGSRKVDFYFATCEDGKRSQAWTVQTSAPADAYDEGTFNSIMSSLKTDRVPSTVDGKCPK